MDSTTIAAIIGATATIIAATLGQKGIFDKMFLGQRTVQLLGKWESTWIDFGDKTEKKYSENFYVTKQKGSKIFGYISMDSEPGKRWEFEGNFTGRFLQLFYYPSKDAEDKLFLDYGCYFFDLMGDGSFDGYSVGYYWDKNEKFVSMHSMKRV